MANQRRAERRSGCPLNASVEMLGDRWSLLIIRDMMLRGAGTFKEFLEGDEGIATNILADRLRRLSAYGIITTKSDPWDGRKVIYQLTPKGIDLAPVLTEMVLWASAHEDTGNQALVRLDAKGQKAIFERDTTTLGTNHPLMADHVCAGRGEVPVAVVGLRCWP